MWDFASFFKQTFLSPEKSQQVKVSTALFGLIVSEEPFNCMKTSLGNASIGNMLYSGNLILMMGSAHLGSAVV